MSEMFLCTVTLVQKRTVYEFLPLPRVGFDSPLEKKNAADEILIRTIKNSELIA